MKWTLESTLTGEGDTLWRAELVDGTGLSTDFTRWVTGPRQAIRDGNRLADGLYWAEDDQPHPRRGFVTAA